MADERREELLRRAVESSLEWDIDADGKDRHTDIKQTSSIPPVMTTAASASLSTSNFTSAEGINVQQYVAAPASVSSPPPSTVPRERPQNMTDTPKAGLDSISVQPSSPAVAFSPDTAMGGGPIRPQGPVGIDIGTTAIVIAEGREKQIDSIKQTTFSTSIPLGSFTKSLLFEHEVPYFELSNFEYLQGYAYEMIGNTFHGDPLWTYSKKSEQAQPGLCLIEAILQNLLGRPKIPGLPLYFSVPGESIDGGNSLLYHTGLIQAFLAKLGYVAMPLNEGLAVVMAELADNNYTGVGISIGGGMTHVCLAYLSVPLISFSIPKGGDSIDRHVSACTGELLFDVKAAKENTFDLAIKPATHVDRALSIYYDDLVKTVVTAIKNKFRGVDLPIYQPVPLVFSGGVMKTKGLQAVFEKALKSTRFPVGFSRIQLAGDPVTAVARGALVKAMAEGF